MVFRADTGNNRKIDNFYAFGNCQATPKATFNLENINLLSNPNVHPKMKLLLKKRLIIIYFLVCKMHTCHVTQKMKLPLVTFSQVSLVKVLFFFHVLNLRYQEQ